MHPLDSGNVSELQGILRRRLDDKGAGAQHPIEQPVPELDTVDPRQGNVDTRAGQHTVAIHHPPVGDHEMCRQPRHERP